MIKKPLEQLHIQKIEDPKCIEDQAEARDTYKTAYMIHFLLGAGNLLPWNALITAVDYFMYLYPTKHVEKVFSVAYMSSSLLVLVVMMMSNKRPSFRVRMNVGFSMFVVALMVNPIMDWANSRPQEAYLLTVGLVIICGFADGLIGGSLIGSAGKLPNQYMQAVFAGTASSGVLVSTLRIITKASLCHSTNGLRTSAHLYFIVSTVILLICIMCCNLLYKLPIMMNYYKLLHTTHPSSSFWYTLRKIKGPAFGILMIYTVTLSIFPGFIAENLKSKVLGDWYPILLITMYNVSDLVGKSLTAIYVMKGIGKATCACFSRILFCPLFAACLHGPAWLKTEFPVAVLTFMLGLTNGYLTSVIMIVVPKSVPESEAETSAVVMAVFLGLGLVCGSILGWIWIV